MTMYHSHTISLYCDNANARNVDNEPKAGEHLYGEFPTLFNGNRQQVLSKRARQAGWKFIKRGNRLLHLCPRCVNAGVRL